MCAAPAHINRSHACVPIRKALQTYNAVQEGIDIREVISQAMKGKWYNQGQPIWNTRVSKILWQKLVVKKVISMAAQKTKEDGYLCKS
jgi:hypothetical protein